MKTTIYAAALVAAALSVAASAHAQSTIEETTTCTHRRGSPNSTCDTTLTYTPAPTPPAPPPRRGPATSQVTPSGVTIYRGGSAYDSPDR